MFIPNPDLTHPRSRIPDLASRIQKTATKERVEKKLIVIFFFVATNFTKLKIIFEMPKKKIQRTIELFTPKIVTKLSKIWVWDPGSEIRDPEKT
jgi:hypothetical protein